MQHFGTKDFQPHFGQAMVVYMEKVDHRCELLTVLSVADSNMISLAHTTYVDDVASTIPLEQVTEAINVIM